MGSPAIMVALVTALTGCSLATLQPPAQNRVPKQIHTKATVVETEEDHNPAESHFGGGEAHGHGKYFMDTIMIQTGPHQVEFGHVCEDPSEWEQRYERRDLDSKRFQGKARWGDKHGGYGEHYWDYNHAGHHDDGGGGGSSDDAGDDGSEAVPQYQPTQGEARPEHRQQLYDQDDRVKRDHKDPVTKGVKSSSPTPASTTTTTTAAPLSLAYDEESGTVVNEATGQRFLLTPIN